MEEVARGRGGEDATAQLREMRRRGRAWLREEVARQPHPELLPRQAQAARPHAIMTARPCGRPVLPVATEAEAALVVARRLTMSICSCWQLPLICAADLQGKKDRKPSAARIDKMRRDLQGGSCQSKEGRIARVKREGIKCSGIEFEMQGKNLSVIFFCF